MVGDRLAADQRQPFLQGPQGAPCLPDRVLDLLQARLDVTIPGAALERDLTALHLDDEQPILPMEDEEIRLAFACRRIYVVTRWKHPGQ